MNEEIKQLLIDCANFIQPYDDGGNEAERLMERLDKALEEGQTLPIHSVSEPLDIFMTYDRHDGEVFAAFTSKKRCELESEECQTPMQQTKLYFGERK